jgi:glycosyltransferase involved in cell wall biosynthesis
LFNCCTVLAYEGSYEAFERTFDSLKAAKGFTHTLVILVFPDKLYNLDAEIFARIHIFPPNVKCVIGAPTPEATLAAIAEEIAASGAPFAAFIDSGDTIGAHYLEYIGYFFEANGEKCRTVFTPVLKPGESDLPPEFREPGAGGLSKIGAFEDIPAGTKGAAITAAAIAEIGTDAAQGKRAFADLLAKTALADRVKGMLTTVSYTSDSAKIEEIPEAQYGGLVKYCAGIFEDLRSVPSIEILKIENYFTDIQISGIYSYGAGAAPGDLKVSGAEIADFKVTEFARNFEDRLFPSAEFSFKITAKDGAAAVKFSQKRKRILDITLELSDPEFERFNNYKAALAGNELRVAKIAPRAFYKVSVIIPVFNGAEFLKEAFDSVREQTLGFFESIQVIFVNDGSNDGSGEICEEYAEKFPYNVTYLSQENAGVSAARNFGLTVACGKYVAFLDADDKFSPGYLAAGVKYLDSNKEKTDVAAFPIEYFGGKAERKASLNFRFNKTAIIDIENDWNYSQFSVSSALIRRSALVGLRFNTQLRYSEDAEFMHRLLLKSMNYAVIKEPAYLYRENGSEDSATSNKALREDWYRKNKIFGKELLEYSRELYGNVTKYTQYLFVHSLIDNIIAKIPEGVEADVDGSLESIAETLKSIDDEIINAAPELNKWLKCYLLKLKHGTSELKFTNFEPGFYIGGTLFEGLETEIHICQIKEAENLLKLSGYYDLPWSKGIELVAEFNGEIYKATLSESSGRSVYFLGRTVHEGCVFNFEIPINEASAVEFFLRNTEEKWAVTLKFSANSGFSNLPDAFSAGKNFIISKSAEINRLDIEAFGTAPLSGAIAKYLAQLSGDAKNAVKAVYDEYLRMYTLFGKSRIWLFMDNIMTAGFGAEEMFTYCNEKNDGIDKYFVIGKDTLDGYRLGQLGTVIDYGSSMHKMLYLFAEKIITSEIEQENYNPFIKENLTAVSGSLSKADIVYIPREIISVDASKTFNALTKNISLITVSTEAEREYLTGGDCGFSGETVVKTGLPKFDLMPEEHDYNILIMPNYQKITDSAYDFDFAASEYCKNLSDLLCDERLLDASDEFEFEIDFAPHTDTYVQLADYDIDDDVEVIPPTRPRAALFADCAVLITDSLAVFDYVYMKRPVIYFPFSDVETKFLGGEMPKFGATAENLDDLIDLIIGFMRDGCEMPPEYCERVDAFFGGVDRENRERIYARLLGA